MRLLKIKKTVFEKRAYEFVYNIGLEIPQINVSTQFFGINPFLRNKRQISEFLLSTDIR